MKRAIRFVVLAKWGGEMTLGEVLLEQCGFFFIEVSIKRPDLLQEYDYKNIKDIFIDFEKWHDQKEWYASVYKEGDDQPQEIDMELAKAIYTRLKELNESIVHEEM